jgi:hypothetical protein
MPEGLQGPWGIKTRLSLLWLLALESQCVLTVRSQIPSHAVLTVAMLHSSLCSKSIYANFDRQRTQRLSGNVSLLSPSAGRPICVNSCSTSAEVLNRKWNTVHVMDMSESVDTIAVQIAFPAR